MSLSAGVSLVAAVVSIVGALVASRGASAIASLNHRVAAIDRAVDELREAYGGLMGALGDVDAQTDIRERRSDSVRVVSKALAALEMLAAARLADDELRHSLEGMREALANHEPELGNLDPVRENYRRVQATLETERRALLFRRWLPTIGR